MLYFEKMLEEEMQKVDEKCSRDFDRELLGEGANDSIFTGSKGRKDDTGKVRYDLLPFDALHEICKVFTEGAKKYTDRNWEAGIKYSRILAAIWRHLVAFAMGKRINAEDFGLHHLAHAAVCCMMLLAYDLRGMRKEWNDMPALLEEKNE